MPVLVFSAVAHLHTAHDFLLIIYFPDTTIWCCNLFVLEHTEEMQDLAWITSRVYTWETLIKQCLFFVISIAGWALLMQFCATLHAPESLSHLLQTREITEVIGPKWGGVLQRSLQTAAAGLQLTGQLNKKLEGALEKWGPDLFWNATINCNALSPMRGWLNVLLNCPDLWGHLADFICHC